MIEKDVVWYASIRSPYSWLALERAAQDGCSRLLDVSTMRMFFEPQKGTQERLEADGVRFHYTPMSKAKHLYILRDVRRLALKHGIERITWPIDTAVNWEISTVLCQQVLDEDQKMGKRLVMAISRARWTKGLDVGSESELMSVLESVGSHPRATDSTRHNVLDMVATRMDKDGVFGVPLFKVGREPFWGYDRLDDAEACYRERCQEAQPRSLGDRSTEPTSHDVSAEGHAGGCG
ncbi:DsbA family protein [Actinomyces slackii]|uniref:DSBA-like thioredoxin domain n=1 Tax=Actinomyces slackii TaxID=52774 RepID=A0A448KFT5_9ACTO|nr:DsbA family protein [Actinomyces slackii]VEG75775.1 DSBA-like thioredoxin domain [Actinomyces slackii]